jgi:antitoxin VapB
MGEERHVRLFRNGRSQAVRIPRDFELPGNEAIMRQEDGKLVIEVPRKKSLKHLLALMQTWEPLSEDEQFPDIDDPPPEPFTLFDDL